MEDRPHRPVGLRVEVQAQIARDRKDAGAPDVVPSLIEPEEVVEEDAVGACGDEVVGIVQADQEGCVRLADPGGDALPDVVEVAGGRGIAEERCSGRPQTGYGSAGS